MYKDLQLKVPYILACNVLLLCFFQSYSQLNNDSASVYNQENPLKVLSYNIRTSKAEDGKNSWNKRKENVVKVLNNYSPDIIGLQESEIDQTKFIHENLPQYGYVAVGRNDGAYSGEACPIFYKKERFIRIDSKTWWLSSTPNKIGSKGWDAALPRIVTCLILMDTYSGNYLYVFNTHLDHRGKKSRLEAAKLIKSKIAEYVKDDAVILLGDFNSEPNDEPYKFFTNTDQKLFDTHTNTQHFEGEEPFTYYGFDISANEGKRLDYVFVNDKMKILNYEIIVDNDGNFYFSDHLPVLVRLKFL